jgi:rhodanese-related sulfurtransferase
MQTLVILAILIFGWEIVWSFAGVKPLFPWQLKKMLQKGKKPVRLIDVRTPLEFNWFHIEGVVNRPDILINTDRYKDENLDEPVVIICMTGHRSPPVAYQLKKRGYKRVYNLTWGMLAWKLFGGKTS